MLLAVKVNGVCYKLLANVKGDIVYKEEITEIEYNQYIGKLNRIK